MDTSVLKIDRIQKGVVIDHIQAGKSMEIYHYLNLAKLDCTVAIIKNVRSRKYGMKDIIKIENNIEVDLDILGFIDSEITINVIDDGEITTKRNLVSPDRIKNIIKCKNPRCITNSERNLEHEFELTDKNTREYSCVYCETKAEI